MSLKILSIKKTIEFNKIGKIAKKFIVSNFVILTSPTPKSYLKISISEIKSSRKSKELSTQKTSNTLQIADQNFKQISQKPKNNNSKNTIFFTDNFCRVGYTVSKNVSKLATKRNLIKRRLREILKVNIKYLKKHQDYIIIARSPIIQASDQQIARDFIFALKHLNNEKNKINKNE
jgi:ribonuclease P protein component